MKTLYKRDTKGKTRFLKIYTTGDKLIQESGVLGTDSPIVHEKVCKPKNVGKSNATNGKEQALSEAQSKINEKLTQGYFESEDALTEGGSDVILPMLAKVYEKESHKIAWDNAYAQPKLDGQRCISIVKKGKVNLISRQGKEIETVQHINKALSKLPDGCYDGELYSLELGGFQKQMKAIKKYRPGITEKIAHNLYDIIDNGAFIDRYNMLQELKLADPIRLVMTYTIDSHELLEEYYGKFVEAGYEGAMVRWGNEGYKINGRSSHLLKYKKFIDITAKIIDIYPAEDRPTWGLLKCQAEDGTVFNATPKMSHAEKEELLKNKKKYIGQTWEIRFFEYFEDGVTPRFAVGLGERLDK